jgi:type I restriction enzyme S subunit
MAHDNRQQISRNSENNTMTKHSTGLVPKLRFPEFRNEREWSLMKIGDILDAQSSTLALNKLELVESGYIVYGADGIVGYISNYQHPDIYISIIKDGSGIGRVNLCEAKSSILGTLSALKSKDTNRFNVIWAYYLLNTIDFASYVKGAGIPHIYYSDYKSHKIGVPSPFEQQKIAACLSSLDELIAAENQKLNLLKEHKKGLLQNLFPQEGEKVPRLRFKEFEKDGEWVEKRLGDIGEPLMCKRIFKEETTPNSVNGVPFYKIGTFGKESDSYISKELFEEYKRKYAYPRVGDVLISASGTIGRLVIFDGEPAYFQDSNIIWLGHNEENVLNEFLLYCYSNLKWQTSDGGVISRLYNSDFKRMKISFPYNKCEQQKIASTLSSLDELIQAQTQRIEALQLHKKGLLQGLFPETINN